MPHNTAFPAHNMRHWINTFLKPNWQLNNPVYKWFSRIVLILSDFHEGRASDSTTIKMPLFFVTLPFLQYCIANKKKKKSMVLQISCFPSVWALTRYLFPCLGLCSTPLNAPPNSTSETRVLIYFSLLPTHWMELEKAKQVIGFHRSKPLDQIGQAPEDHVVVIVKGILTACSVSMVIKKLALSVRLSPKQATLKLKSRL